MANWSGFVLTDVGAKLQAKINAGLTTLKFTKLGIGSGSGSGSINALTAMVNKVQDINIGSVKVNNNIVTINSTLTNKGLGSAYQMRELGLFATDPDVGEILFAYMTDNTPDTMPADGSATVVSQDITLNITFSNTGKVSATIDTGAFVTHEDLNTHNTSSSAHADIRTKITSDINAHNSSGTSHADIRRMFNNYLPLTGGTVSGRTHIDAMLSVGQSSAVASNIRVDSAAGNAYMALLNYNNTNSLLIDGYFNNPETATIDVTNRSTNGTVRYRSTLIDGKGNAKFANEVYANEKLLSTKEYVDSKCTNDMNAHNTSSSAHSDIRRMFESYLPLTGGTLTGSLSIDGGNNIVHYIGQGGGTTGGNLNLGSATSTKSTALCCINRPMWWDNTSVRNLAVEEDISKHNTSSSAHADIRQMFNNYWSRAEADNRFLLSNHLSVTSGTVANGAGIPIPNGYVLNQCRFLVSFSDDNPSHYWYDINEGGINQMDQKICRVKPGTNIVECYWLAQGYDSWNKPDRNTRLVLSGENELIDGKRYYKMPAIANYICIAVK